MLEHEETMALIKLAQAGDEGAKVKLLEHNTPLLKSIIRRYVGKNVEYDDLFQISCVGFLKAIKNFSDVYGVRFSTYAVPMILGEVKRFMRDDGYIKVSRSLKALSYKINSFIEHYKDEHNAQPSIETIAKEFNIDKQEVVFAMDSNKMPISLFEKSDENDDKALCLMDKLATDEDSEGVINHVLLKSVIEELSPREKKIIMLRYFRDKTQSEIAEQLGVSQVQVSRLENKIIARLREKFLDK